MARGLADESRANGDAYALVERDARVSTQTVCVLHTAGDNAKMWIWVERGRRGGLGGEGGDGVWMRKIAQLQVEAKTLALLRRKITMKAARKHCYADGYI